MKILVITDNKFIFEWFSEHINSSVYDGFKFDFFFSSRNEKFKAIYKDSVDFRPILLKDEIGNILDEYQLSFSLHSKQLFPAELVNNMRCINIHPGLNPYNRGWFPQVFSIINKLPIGVTIHEMDEQIDHGPIIIQEELRIYDWETSYDVYRRIQLLEVELLSENLKRIINNDYDVLLPSSEGNINSKRDFDKLCQIDLDRKVSFKEAIDFFRALSFKGYKNAYFYDKDGNKVFVEMELNLEEDQHD